MTSRAMKRVAIILMISTLGTVSKTVFASVPDKASFIASYRDAVAKSKRLSRKGGRRVG